MSGPCNLKRIACGPAASISKRFTLSRQACITFLQPMAETDRPKPSIMRYTGAILMRLTMITHFIEAKGRIGFNW